MKGYKLSEFRILVLVVIVVIVSISVGLYIANLSFKYDACLDDRNILNEMLTDGDNGRIYYDNSEDIGDAKGN